MEVHEKDQDWKILAKHLRINLRAAYHWLGNDQLAPLMRGRTISKKSDDIVEFLEQHVESNPTVSLKELQLKLASKMNSNIFVKLSRIG